MPRTSKSRIGDHSDAKWFIIIGVLLTLFAGSVVLLVKSPQIRTIFVRLPVPAPEEAAQPEEAAAPALEGLPEGGSVELMNDFEATDPAALRDQKIVWRTEGKPDLMLVESVRTLLPGLTSNNEALFIFAKPTNEARVFFAANCYYACDSLPHDLIAFDPKLRAFIPLLNAPRGDLIAVNLSQNQRRLAFGGPADELGEIRELWVYDLVDDKLSRPLTLPSTESLTAYQARAEGDAPLVSRIDVSWKDPTQVTYKVFRAGGTIPEGSSAARKPTATRTTQVAP